MLVNITAYSEHKHSSEISHLITIWTYGVLVVFEIVYSQSTICKMDLFRLIAMNHIVSAKGGKRHTQPIQHMHDRYYYIPIKILIFGRSRTKQKANAFPK